MSIAGLRQRRRENASLNVILPDPLAATLTNFRRLGPELGPQIAEAANKFEGARRLFDRLAAPARRARALAFPKKAAISNRCGTACGARPEL
jgi:hypothetical protein